MRRILAAVWLTACASEGAIRPEQVRIVTEKPDCPFVQQQVCGTSRGSGMARCHAWHKEVAAKAGANTVHVIAYEGDQLVVPTGAFAHSTSMTADYYACPAGG